MKQLDINLMESLRWFHQHSKKRFQFEAEVTGHPRDAAEGRWALRVGIEFLMHLQILWSQKEQSQI